MMYALSLIIKATAVLAITGLAVTLCRSRSAAVRHAIWLCGLAGILLLPVVTEMTPQWSPVPAVERTAAAAERIVIDVVASGGARGVSWTQGLAWLWLIGVSLVAARFGVAHLAARRIAWRALPFNGDRRVRLSGEIQVPMVSGIVSPIILLPQGAEHWAKERLRLVLAHESMHIERRDLATQALAQAACTLYWFHPLVWWAAQCLHLECEQACDDGVLAQGEKASTYAGHLVDIVRGITAEPRMSEGVIAMARISQLEQRLTAMFQPQRDRQGAGPRLFAVAGFLAAALILPLAAVRAPAQPGPGTLAGTVRDASGAAIPKAQVTLWILGTDRREFTKTNDAGEFAFSPVPDGRYKVTIAKPGFALATMEGVDVTSGKPVRLTLTLALGKVQETVNVMGDRPDSARASSNTSPATTEPKRILVGGNVQATKMLRKVNPIYPASCKAEGIEGTVVLKTVISREGLPLNVEAVNQLIDKRLVESAVDAVKQWQWSPTLLNGQPVEIITEVQVNYTLADKKPQ